MTLNYSIIDAFTDRPFQGNPAAVVLDADDLPVARMHQIAAEFNLSETAFVLRPAGSRTTPAIRLRWFTPHCEVSFCGHATLAAVHAHCVHNDTERNQTEYPHDEQRGRPVESTEIAVECAAGILAVKIEYTPKHCYWLSMPNPELTPLEFPTEVLFQALGLPAGVECPGAPQRTRDRDVVLFVKRGSYVRSLQPNMSALDRWSRQYGIRGVSVASDETGDSSVACISRFFAPAAGIPEDPVTGSVHGPLAEFLITRRLVAPSDPDRWSFRCQQLPANGRIGDILVRARSTAHQLAIEVGGSCVTVMTGHMRI